MPDPPIAKLFLSYAHHDEKHSEGFISGFREVLADEVRSALGRSVEISQDTNFLDWGGNWRKQIKSTITESSFLIAFVTPSFVHSEGCRREVEIFRGVERAQRRDDLILVVHYIHVPELSDPDEAETAEIRELARLLEQRQAADFRAFRDESPNSAPVRSQIRTLAENLARRIRRSRSVGGGGGSRPPPTGLPDFVPRSVLGREPTLEELREALRERETVLVALVGEAGIGKTAVAVQVARDLAPLDPRYLAARGYPPVNVDSVLLALVEAIPDQREQALMKGHVQSDRLTTLEKLDAVLDRLTGHPVLLILDDGEALLEHDGAWLDQGLGALLEDLAGQVGREVRVLLVGARAPRAELFRRVEITTGIDASEFPQFLAALDSELATLPAGQRDRLASVTRRWPRPAELVHGVLAGGRTSVTALLERADGKRPLGQSASSGLDEDELAAVRVLAVCGRPLPVEAVAKLTGRDARKAEEVLAALAGRRIVRHAEERYHLPCPQQWGPFAEGGQLRRQAAAYFETECRKIGPEARLVDLGCYFDAIELYLACEDDEQALDLACELDERYLAGRGQTGALTPYLTRLAGRLTEPHPRMVTALMLARALVQQGRAAQSIPYAAEALELVDTWRDTGDQLIVLNQIGHGYFADGLVSEAAHWYAQAIELGAGWPSRADSYYNLARCQYEIGQHQAARESLTAARRELEQRSEREHEAARESLTAARRELEQRSEREHDDRVLEALILIAQARLAFEVGELAQCRTLTKLGRAAAVAVGAEFDAARCDDIESWALLRAGDGLGAIEAAKRAFALAGQIVDAQLSRVCSITLAVQHLLRGEHDLGHRAADVAVRASRSHPAAGACAILGVARLRRHELQPAKESFERALWLADAARDKEPAGYSADEARGLALAGLALARGTSDDAAADAFRDAARKSRNAPGARFRQQRMVLALIAGRGPDELPAVRRVLDL